MTNWNYDSSSVMIYKKYCLCLRSHGRRENYEPHDEQILRHCSLSFGILPFNLLVLHLLGRVILHRRIQLLRFSAHLFTIFLHTRISRFPFYFQFVIDFFSVTKDI